MNFTPTRFRFTAILLAAVSPAPALALDPYRTAIEEKNADAPVIVSRLRSTRAADQRSALHALSQILTPASERALVEFRANHPATKGHELEPTVYAELYAAMGQHAWDKAFTADGGALVRAALAAESDRLFAPSGAPMGPVPGVAVAELATAIAHWGFLDPHPTYVALSEKIAASAYGNDEDVRRGAVQGWMRTRFARFSQVPADAPTPEIPAALKRLLAVERAAARTLPYLRAIVFGASHWKVELPLLDVMVVIDGTPDRDTRLSAFDQLTRLARDGVAPYLEKYLADADRLIRLNAFEALAKSADGTAARLLAAIAAEDAPSERAEMVRIYLASAKASPTVEEAEAIYASAPAGGPFDWARGNAFSGILSRTTVPAALADAIRRGLADPAVIVQRIAAAGLAKIEDFGVRTEIVRTRLAAGDVHPIVEANLLDALEDAPPVDDALFALFESRLLARSAAVRGTAVSGILAFAATRETDVVAHLANAWVASSGPANADFRESIVDGLSEKAKGTAATALLERIRAEDAEPAVSNAARKALLDRGVANVPAERAVTFRFSPYRELPLTTTRPRVELRTTRGTVVIDLYADLAPMHARTFIGLVESGFYDGMEWYRIEPDFVIQGGDREGTGWGGVGFNVRGENTRAPYSRGSLGMARGASFDSGSSHVFISTYATSALDRLYTNFGRATKETLDVLDRVEPYDRIVEARVIRR